MPKREYKTEAIKLSNSDNWRTPQWLFNDLNTEFKFQIDLCADRYNAKLPRHYSLENSALLPNNRWNVSAFANVPYSAAAPFLAKARVESDTFKVPIVILLRVDTSNNWWYDLALKADEIRFLVGRLKFLDENNQPHFTAKWANAILVYGADYYEGRTVSWWKYKEGQEPKQLLSFREEY